MTGENEVPSADEDIVMRVVAEAMLGSTPNATVLRVTKQLRIELSALRASWEMEKVEMKHDLDALKDFKDDIISALGLTGYSIQVTGIGPLDVIADLKKEKGELELTIKNLQADDEEQYGQLVDVRAEKQALEERVKELNESLKLYQKLLPEEEAKSDGFEAENLRLKAENEAQTYKGNSIGYIYDKMIAYQTQVFPLSNALKELGFNYPESGKDNMARERALIEWAHNKKESFDTLTCALAEAREALEYVDCQKFYTSCKEEKDKGKVFTSCLRCEALSNPTSLRASEEMKALRERMKLMWEVVTYANTVRNDILIPETDDQVEMSCQCKEWVDGLLERLKALEAYERGKV